MDIPSALCCQRKNLKAEKGACPEELTKKGNTHQDQAIAESIAEAIDKTGDRWVAHGKALSAGHDNAVSDDKSYVDGELLGQIKIKGPQELVNQDNQSGNDGYLDTDADTVGYLKADNTDGKAGEGNHQGYTDRHDKCGGHLGGNRQGGAYTKNQQGDWVALQYGAGQQFAVRFSHLLPPCFVTGQRTV